MTELRVFWKSLVTAVLGSFLTAKIGSMKATRMPSQAQMNENSLAQVVGRITQTDGDFSTAIPELMLFRRSVATVPMPCIYGLGLGIAVQGQKRVTLGQHVFDYGPGQSLVTAVDLPVVSYVTQASAALPYLGVYLGLDARLITQLAADMDGPRPVLEVGSRAMAVISLDGGLLDAMTRLIRLLNEPGLVPQITPLILQEITVRLLNGPHGPMLRHLVASGSPSQQIAKVMAWLKQHFMDEVTMDQLADRAHMSPSTFRQHFRSVSGTSPLQYLKHLRLQAARQMMMNEGLDAGSTALRIGYESASQFNREYSRLFGQPPLRDIRRVNSSLSLPS
jgi:AraC-like DNA-binding protein